MEGQFLSLICLLWSVNNTAQNLKPLQMQGVRKSVQFSPEYRPISFIRWDKFGDKKSGKDGKYKFFWTFTLKALIPSPEAIILQKELRVVPSVVIFGTGAHYSSIKYPSLQSALSDFKRNFQQGLELLCRGPVKVKSADILVWKSATPHFFNRDLGKSLRKGMCEE